MLRFFSGLMVGGLLGMFAGGAAMLIGFPFLFPPAVVNESVADMVTIDVPELISRAQFRTDSPGQDGAHWGRGNINIYRHGDDYLLELQQNFEVGPGPNFWLYLNQAPGIEEEKDFLADAGRYRLAKLKSFTGMQVYRVSAQTFESAQALTIWCDSFAEYIASADLDISLVTR